MALEKKEVEIFVTGPKDKLDELAKAQAETRNPNPTELKVGAVKMQAESMVTANHNSPTNKTAVFDVAYEPRSKAEVEKAEKAKASLPG